MELTLSRNGTKRTWFDRKGKKHIEEVFTVYLNGIKLARGMCSRYVKRLVRLSHGESASFKLTRIDA